MPRYNPAPGWPAAPAEWLPPRGWRPEPGWAPAPDGWQLVAPSDGDLVVDPSAGRQRERELRAWTATAAARYQVVSVAPSYGRPEPVLTGSRRPLSPLGRASLVLAVLVSPLGLVLSLVALARVDPARERGRAWAVAGLMVALPLILFWWDVIQSAHGGT